ncbi:MAG: hypothetical protein Q6K80_07360 [Thermostichus sp. DG_1_6_bins_120]
MPGLNRILLEYAAEGIPACGIPQPDLEIHPELLSTNSFTATLKL